MIALLRLMVQENKVAEVVADFADHMTLFAAVMVADIISTLNNKLPFTAFARHMQHFATTTRKAQQPFFKP